MAQCFVVQGFGKKTDYTDGRVLDLDASYAVIKEAVTSCGVECVRADEIMHSGTIDKPMYEQLLGAELVIADLSTYNVNAAFELGIRYALRPHATIVVAEEQFKPVFDVTHIVIRRYKHLGEDIGRKEAQRFQSALRDAILGILAQSQVDSPVYTFLPELEPPRARARSAAAVIEATAVELAKPMGEAAPAALPSATHTGEASNKSLLDKAKTAMQDSDFSTARDLLQQLHERLPNDHHVVHQLTLATYKSRQPDARSALEKAREVLSKVAPASTNDPETLGLWGAIHKRLYDFDGDPRLLNQSITAYGRGYQLKQDYYNGVNYAILLEVRGLVHALAARSEDAIADRVTARRTRLDVISGLQVLLPQLGDDADLEKRYWAAASEWEAYAGLGMNDQAAASEARALALNPPKWMLATTREQITRIKDTQQKLAASLNALR